ncbi:hypothetical protein [Dokdonella sp.]|uniref:hypothetical protein n=1 Tax=Dokdonella sp. TaxID=2291710 RepID=UPI0025BF7A09|nr:hypothetical protein [Dokdonella sp.]
MSDQHDAGRFAAGINLDLDGLNVAIGAFFQDNGKRLLPVDGCLAGGQQLPTMAGRQGISGFFVLLKTKLNSSDYSVSKIGKGHLAKSATVVQVKDWGIHRIARHSRHPQCRQLVKHRRVCRFRVSLHRLLVKVGWLSLIAEIGAVMDDRHDSARRRLNSLHFRNLFKHGIDGGNDQRPFFITHAYPAPAIVVMLGKIDK